MVMKKFMSEVQKQSKDKDKQMVTPIRVTRSVGLQVSFMNVSVLNSGPFVSLPGFVSVNIFFDRLQSGKLTRVLPQGQNQPMVNISPQLAKQMAKVPMAKPLQQTGFNVAAQNVSFLNVRVDFVIDFCFFLKVTDTEAAHRTDGGRQNYIIASEKHHGR